MKYSLRSFKDIIDAICEELKIQATDTESRRRIKRNVNTVYLNTVVPFKRWQWLRTSVTLGNEPYFNTGTANVQQNVSLVTLTQAPGTSRRGYYFAADGQAEIYRIQAHAAGSLTMTLETPFNGATNTASTFKIWTDAIPLPADCKEVVEVSQNRASSPIQGVGIQEMRRIQGAGGAAIGSPSFYSTGPYVQDDGYGAIAGFPTAVSRSSVGLMKSITFSADLTLYVAAGETVRISGVSNTSYNGEVVLSSVVGTTLSYVATTRSQESAIPETAALLEGATSPGAQSYRNLLVYPAITDRRLNLLVDYQLNVEELDADTDEPKMPVENRIVLFYGGMWLSASRERDAEWAQENYALMQSTLGRMAGKTEDTPERPVFRVSSNYLGSKRGGGTRRSYLGYGSESGFTTQGGNIGSPPTPTGTPNSVAIFDDNGYLIGSQLIDLNALNFLIGAQGGLTASLPASTTTVVDDFSATTYKAVQLYFSIQRGATNESGTFWVTTNGASCSYSTAGASTVSPTGVSLSASIVAGNIEVSATVDASGPTAVMNYRLILL